MPVFELQTPDGKTFEVDAPDMNAALAALGQQGGEQTEQPRGITQADLFNPEIMAKARSQDRQQQYDNLPGWAKPIVAVDDLATLAGNGATFGFMDNAAAGIDTLMGRGTYEDRLAYRKGQVNDARDRAGIPGMVAEIGGSVVPVAKLAKMGVTATNLPALTSRFGGKIASVGNALGKYGGMTLDGAAYGGLTAYGNEQPVAQGMGLGAVIGGGTQAATNLLSPLLKPITSRLFPDRAAANVMDDAMKAAKMTPQQIEAELAAARADGQNVYTVADALGHPGQRLTSTIVRTPNEGRTPMVNFLEKRQAGQGRRISNSLSDAFSPQTAQQMNAAVKDTARATNKNPYAAAYDEGDKVIWSPELERLSASPAIQSAMGGAQKVWQDNVIADGFGAMNPGAKVEGNGILSFLHGKVPVFPNLQFWDYTKRVLDDEINTAVRAGQDSKVRTLTALKKRMVAELDKASPTYANARATAKGFFDVQDAIEAGKDAAKRGRIEDTIPAFQQLNPAEKQGFRTGYVDPLIETVQGSPFGTNKARPLISDATAAEFPAFSVPGQGDKLMRKLGREQTMFETRATAAGGSKTFDNQADEAALSFVDPSIVGNMLTGNFGGALKSAVLQSLSSLKGQPASVRERLARALMETDPVAARGQLMKVINTINASDKTKQMLIRALTVSGTAGLLQAQN